MAIQTRNLFDPAQLASARGATKTRLTELVGVHRQRIQEWEAGVAAPHPRHLKVLASVLEVEPSVLVACETLRGRRYAAGFTQATAADRIGVSRAEWARWEAGLTIPARHQAAVHVLLGSG